ncbi:RadC family protein [Brevundimonas sp.]|uniref:RadC family protein n=1 Tax=Brevundimonas sp. TaxID=1871086 RepID=UPI0028B239E5|nr:DNA repair protein RadC [Brevundimonas sp.]
MRSFPAFPRTTDAILKPPDADRLSALDDHHLLSLLLGRNPAVSPVSVEALFDRFGDLGAIASADLPELARTSGLGAAALTDLKLCRQLSERLVRCEAARRSVISSWTALLAYAKVALAHLPREQFRALFLDRRNRLMRDELIAEGTVDHAPVYPREVVRRALEVSASALILVHNHPSGDPEPSRADIDMTHKVVDAAKVFDIQVYDHLVVGREGTASFRSMGLMK